MGVDKHKLEAKLRPGSSRGNQGTEYSVRSVSFMPGVGSLQPASRRDGKRKRGSSLSIVPSLAVDRSGRRRLKTQEPWKVPGNLNQSAAASRLPNTSRSLPRERKLSTFQS